MRLEQIFILNRALDGKDIYSLPSFAGMGMQEMAVSLHKDTLVRSGILKTHTSFTEKGLETTAIIAEFKKAKKYVKVLDLVIGLIDESRAVALQAASGDYTFTLIDSKGAAGQLARAYGFLAAGCTGEEDSEQMDPKELLTQFRLGSDNSFGLSTEQGAESTAEIYFFGNGGIHVYDCKERVLHRKSPEGASALLKERMAV